MFFPQSRISGSRDNVQKSTLLTQQHPDDEDCDQLADRKNTGDSNDKKNQTVQLAKAGTPTLINRKELFAGVIHETSTGLYPLSRFPSWTHSNTRRYGFRQLEKAKRLATGPLRPDELNIWVDGSQRLNKDDRHAAPTQGAYSVVFRNALDPGNGERPEDWVACYWRQPVFGSDNAELVALCEGLNMAKTLRTAHPYWKKAKVLYVNIFSDSKNMLRQLEQGLNLTDLHVRSAVLQPGVEDFIRLTRDVDDLDSDLTLRWIQGHGHTVLPHVIADQAASRASMPGQREQSFVSGLGPAGRYHPIGPRLFEKTMTIARRHPHLDNSGANFRFPIPHKHQVERGLVPSDYRPGVEKGMGGGKRHASTNDDPQTKEEEEPPRKRPRK